MLGHLQNFTKYIQISPDINDNFYQKYGKNTKKNFLKKNGIFWEISGKKIPNLGFSAPGI
jgi:hypothetical protein